MDDRIKILFENQNFLIVFKERGIATAPLSFDQFENNNILSKIVKLYPDVQNVKNSLKECEYGLVHRIDTDTKGIVLIARNTQTWNFFRKIQSANLFKKEYLAFCYKNPDLQEGFPICPFQLKKDQIITSKFRHYGPKSAQVRPVLLDSGNTFASKKASDKIYSTKILNFENLSEKGENEKFRIKCSITQGFRHQVRCHLAWLGFPVIADKVYGFQDKIESRIESQMQFYATALEFPEPNFDGSSSSKILRFDCSSQIKRAAD